MQEDISKIKLFSKDILIKQTDKNQYTGSEIILQNKEKASQAYYCEILKASPDCEHVKVGDIVFVSWERMMIPFDFAGMEVSVTSEDEVLAVIDFEEGEEKIL